jgi:hypothetical protein
MESRLPLRLRKPGASRIDQEQTGAGSVPMLTADDGGMMRNPMRFPIELARQPAWVVAWIAVLMLVNILSIGFWSEPLAKLIFAVFLLSSLLMMGLYSAFGFEKILGAGHALWLPLVVYVLLVLPQTSGNFQVYLMVWSALTAVSLVLDGVDVWRYFARRKPSANTAA